MGGMRIKFNTDDDQIKAVSLNNLFLFMTNKLYPYTQHGGSCHLQLIALL